MRAILALAAGIATANAGRFRVGSQCWRRSLGTTYGVHRRGATDTVFSRLGGQGDPTAGCNVLVWIVREGAA